MLHSRQHLQTTLANRTEPVKACVSFCCVFCTKCVFTDGFSKLQNPAQDVEFSYGSEIVL